MDHRKKAAEICDFQPHVFHQETSFSERKHSPQAMHWEVFSWLLKPLELTKQTTLDVIAIGHMENKTLPANGSISDH